MPLPKVKQPIFELTIPSTQETKKFRPYLGAEEKILLIAKESGETKDIIMSLKQVIQNCCVEDNFDADDLATFDVEYLFLKLRAKSVDNVVKVAYLDQDELDEAEPGEEPTPYEFNIDLNEVEMLQTNNVSNIIEFDETSGIVMKYPSMKEIDNMPSFESAADELNYLIRCSIKSIYDEDAVYPIDEISSKELDEYIDQLPIPVLTKMREYFTNMPRMFHELKYTNKFGKEQTITLRSLSDFFTLR